MKVLALRTEGIGNGILSSPTFMSIKKNIKDVLLDVWVENRSFDLFVNHPYINHLFKWPKIPTNGPYDYGLVLVFDGGLMTEAAKKICKKIIFHPNVNFVKKSEPQHNLEIAKQIGGWDGKYYPTSLYISEMDYQFAKETLQSFVCKENLVPLVGVSIGCETSFPVHKKRFWFNPKWLELIKQIYSKYNTNFVILGGKSEEKETTELVNTIPKHIPVLNMLNKTTIKQACAVIKNCNLFVSIDSGLMHCASVMGTKQIALFGPTSEIKSCLWTDSKNYVIVRYPISCERCYTRNPGLFQSCKNQICMQGISPQMILDVIEKRNWL